MDCLIKLFDREQTSNLIPIFAFKPKQVIILYDITYTSRQKIEFINLSCKAKLPNISIEAIEIDTQNIDHVIKVFSLMIKKYPKCFVDITAGTECAAIGAFIACTKTFTPIFKINIKSGNLISLYGCKSLEKSFKLPELSMDSIFLAQGSIITGYNHPEPNRNLFKNLLNFCEVVFNNLSDWKDFCFFIQIGCANLAASQNLLNFRSPKIIQKNGKKIIFKSYYFLEIAEKFSLIYDVHIEKKQVAFKFANEKIKKYLTDFGVWLELYCYIKIKESKLFNDVRMSVEINWSMKNGEFLEITNEIDLTFFYRIRPCFISCKLSEPSSEALHELSMYHTYFGGRHSRCILVILSNIKNKEYSYLFKRAQEMGIILIDGNSIRKGEFLESLEKNLINKTK